MSIVVDLDEKPMVTISTINIDMHTYWLNGQVMVHCARHVLSLIDMLSTSHRVVIVESFFVLLKHYEHKTI